MTISIVLNQLEKGLKDLSEKTLQENHTEAKFKITNNSGGTITEAKILFSGTSFKLLLSKRFMENERNTALINKMKLISAKVNSDSACSACIRQLTKYKEMFTLYSYPLGEFHDFVQRRAGYRQLFEAMSVEVEKYPELQEPLRALFANNQDKPIADFLRAPNNRSFLQFLVEVLPKFEAIFKRWETQKALNARREEADALNAAKRYDTARTREHRQIIDDDARLKIFADDQLAAHLNKLKQGLRYKNELDALLKGEDWNKHGAGILLASLNTIGLQTDFSLVQKKAIARAYVEWIVPKITSNRTMLQLIDIIDKKHESYAYLREERSFWRFNSHGNTASWHSILGNIKEQMDANVSNGKDETYNAEEYQTFQRIMSEHRGRGFGFVSHASRYEQRNEGEEIHIQLRP